jgi:hypothetical protein
LHHVIGWGKYRATNRRRSRRESRTEDQASRVVDHHTSHGVAQSPGEREEDDQQFRFGDHWTDTATGT